MRAAIYARVSTNLRQLVNALEEFRSLGIEFISLHKGVDTSTPNGRLVFGIFASIAEFERELIRDRVKSGYCRCEVEGQETRSTTGQRGCREDCGFEGTGAFPEGCGREARCV